MIRRYECTLALLDGTRITFYGELEMILATLESFTGRVRRAAIKLI